MQQGAQRPFAGDRVRLHARLAQEFECADAVNDAGSPGNADDEPAGWLNWHGMRNMLPPALVPSEACAANLEAAEPLAGA